MSIAAAHGGYTYRIEDVDSWRSQIQQWFGKGGVFELTDEQRAAFAEKYGYTDGDFDTFISQITDDEYIWKSNWDILQKLLRDLGIGSFDTGGYTGEWGTSEKMALLHEKELVLNQEDTQNILNAVETMRSLENSISASMLENVLTAL